MSKKRIRIKNPLKFLDPNLDMDYHQNLIGFYFLPWLFRHLSTKFCENRLSSYSVILLQTNEGKHTLCGDTNYVCKLIYEGGTCLHIILHTA